MKTKGIVFFYLLIAIFVSCKNENNQKPYSTILVKETEFEKDSIAITNLVKNVYNYHYSKNFEDFPYEYEKDTIVVGINWSKYYENINNLKKTNFFEETFFASHKSIAINLDKFIKVTDIEFRNVNDGILFWELNADSWCSCQDFPNQYWKSLIIRNLIINDDHASFDWTWDKNLTYKSHKYQMKAIKQDNKWKINFIEGFSSYNSFKKQ